MGRAWKRAVVVVSLSGLASCLINISDVDRDRDLDFEVTESFAFQVDATDLTRLALDGINGTVRIVGDSRTAVARVSGERRVRSDSRSDARDFLGSVSVEVTEIGQELRVRTVQPNNTGGREVTVDYDVTVPARFEVEVSHTNGPVDLESLRAAVRVDNVNGSVGVLDVIGDVRVNLVNGDIVADVEPLAGGFVDLLVTNGTVTLDLPGSVSAMLEADVTNGTITVVGLTVLDAVTSTRSVHGRLGGGDGLIDLDVTNGTIVVRER